MTRLSFLIFGAFLLLASLKPLTAQNRENYSLLWEVINPNTAETSYVFGTMHLSDPKVFQFSDEVLLGIQNTEAFATEVHPDSIDAGATQSLYKENATTRYKEVLGKKEYKRLNNKIIEVTGFSLDSLRFNSLDFIEILLKPDVSSQDDEVTFLDDFLHKTALMEGKKLNGLEPIEDQLTDMDDLSDEDIREVIKYLLDKDFSDYKEQLSKFIDIYYSGDIEVIYEKVTDSDVRQLDNLISRNYVMANSIEKITNQNTLFAAIGAAHLAGDEGVLSLLRKKGFTVKKASATFKNNNVDIISKRSLESWKTFRSDKLGYEVLVPTKAKQNLRSKMLSSYNSNTDLINDVTLSHSSIKIVKDKFENNRQLIDTLITNYNSRYGNFTYNEENSLKKENDHYVLLGTSDDEIKRIDVYIKNDQLYLFVAEYTTQAMSEKAAQKFFDSIQLFQPVEETNEWIEIVEELAAYKVNFPKDHKKLDHQITNPLNENDDPFVLNFYYAVNKFSKEQYLVRHSDFPLGYFLEDMETSVDEYVENIKSKKATILSKEKTTFKGLTAYDIELKFYDTYHSRLRLIFRGNRIYLLLVQSLDAEKQIAMDNAIFTSFEIIDYKKDNYETIQVDNKYSFKFPKINRVDVDSTDSNQADLAYTKVYQGLDEYNGNVFTITQSKFGKYFKVKNEKKYLDEYTDLIIEGDSVLSRKEFNHDNITGTELLLDVEKSDLQQRFRIFFNDDSLYLMGTYQDASQIENENSNTFFNSFTSLNNSGFNVEASKSDILFKDLDLDDKNALDALDYYTFDKNDTKKLIELIHKNDPSDSLYYSKRNILIGGLALIQDESTIKNLETLFHSTSNEKVKARIIESLLYYENETATQLSFDLLKKEVPKVDHNELFYLESQNDSIISLEKYRNTIWELNNNTALRGKSLNYFFRKIESDSTTTQFLNQRTEQLIKWFKEDVEAQKNKQLKTKRLTNYNVQSYVDLFEKLKLKDQRITQIIEDYLTFKPMTTGLHYRFFDYYVTTVDDLDKGIIQQFMEPLYYRFEAMQSLAQSGNTNLIPKSHLKDKAYSHLSVFNTTLDYNEEMILKHLGKVKEDDKTYIVFQFNYPDAEEKVDYIAITRVEEININEPQQFTVWLSNEGVKDGKWQKLARKEIKDWNSDD